ncbi:MAG: hydantoinase/oxoprolinase family protein [Candidatus Thiodiazotropha sp.]
MNLENTRTVLLGVDTGGTFTDFVLYRDHRLQTHKVLSTPSAPERAILQGIRELALDPAQLVLIHGSTVATNAALEGKGVRTLYITNRGLGDLLTLGRQARRELYNLQPERVEPPVPADDCVETGGRLGADGSPVEPLTDADLQRLASIVAQERPAAVAINLLYSYLDEQFERRIEALMPESVFCSRSSEVLPASGEYERGIATWLNSWVGPLVAGYIQRLRQGLPGSRIAVMQSSGEAIAAEQAARQAVRMLLSGPAGGLVGAAFMASVSGRDRLLTLDMGGTSTDVALIEGEPRLTREGRIGPWPVAVPMVDMHTIGAGGGSIARLDGGGMLRVGPESAGADPGPACYGRSGLEPTVTDANLVLGRLRPDAFLGGRMTLEREAAETAVARLAQQMGLTTQAAAEGIVRVANEHMTHALRVISVQRGIDPRNHTLVSFGGAGGLHVCALARALGLHQALVPVNAGVLSALGMLATRPGRQLVRTWLGLLGEREEREIVLQLEQLADEGVLEMEREGIPRTSIERDYSLDLRYHGQSYTLNVPWRNREQAQRDFHEHHQARYGHRMDASVELVNLRVALRGAQPDMTLPQFSAGQPGEAQEWLELPGVTAAVPRYARDTLSAGQSLSGPALITEMASTLWLEPGWDCRMDESGNLLLQG